MPLGRDAATQQQQQRRWAWNIGDAIALHPDANVDELVALTEGTVDQPPEGNTPFSIESTLVESFQNLSLLSEAPDHVCKGPSDFLLCGIGLIGFSICACIVTGWRGAVLPIIAHVLGISFYASEISFSGAFLELVESRRSTKARQILFIFIMCSLLSIPLFYFGVCRPHIFNCALAPAIGAFIFGLGMTLAQSSSSGILLSFAAAEPNAIITVLFFGIGSTLGAEQSSAWGILPIYGPVWLYTLGLPGILLHLGGLLLLYLFVALLEFQSHKDLEVALFPSLFMMWQKARSVSWEGQLSQALLRNRMLEILNKSGTILAILCCELILLVQQAPWGLSSAFSQIGARFVNFFSPHTAETWNYFFLDPVRMHYLHHTILADPAFLTSFGFILGSMAIAVFSGRFAAGGWDHLLNKKTIGVDIGGSLLMGYGARIAFGCNISGLMGGMLSGSLHAWQWLAMALMGCYCGRWLRHFAMFEYYEEIPDSNDTSFQPDIDYSRRW